MGEHNSRGRDESSSAYTRQHKGSPGTAGTPLLFVLSARLWFCASSVADLFDRNVGVPSHILPHKNTIPPAGETGAVWVVRFRGDSLTVHNRLGTVGAIPIASFTFIKLNV